MAGMTMGEERNWQQLLRSLERIAKAAERIADSLEGKQDDDTPPAN